MYFSSALEILGCGFPEERLSNPFCYGKTWFYRLTPETYAYILQRLSMMSPAMRSEGEKRLGPLRSHAETTLDPKAVKAAYRVAQSLPERFSPPPGPFLDTAAHVLGVQGVSGTELVCLAAWFMANKDRLPTTPFRLTPWLFLEDPKRYYSVLQTEIEVLPHGPRMRAGVLKEDLLRLRKLLLT